MLVTRSESWASLQRHAHAQHPSPLCHQVQRMRGAGHQQRKREGSTLLSKASCLSRRTLKRNGKSVTSQEKKGCEPLASHFLSSALKELRGRARAPGLPHEPLATLSCKVTPALVLASHFQRAASGHSLQESTLKESCLRLSMLRSRNPIKNSHKNRLNIKYAYTGSSLVSREQTG